MRNNQQIPNREPDLQGPGAGPQKPKPVEIAELTFLKERSRFIMNAFDQAKNTLALLIMQLEACSGFCRNDPGKTGAVLREAIRIARDGLQEIKRAGFGLAAERGDEHGLREALARLMADFQAAGMRIDFSCETVDHSLNPAHGFVLYQVCREALNNSLRHGKASQATVVLRIDGGSLRLTIIDNGGGCKDFVKGLGLSDLERWVWELGGEIAFVPDGESGFVVRVRLPVGS